MLCGAPFASGDSSAQLRPDTFFHLGDLSKGSDQLVTGLSSSQVSSLLEAQGHCVQTGVTVLCPVLIHVYDLYTYLINLGWEGTWGVTLALSDPSMYQLWPRNPFLSA